MKVGGIGGANTKSGLHFEGKVDFLEVLKTVPGYEVHEDGSILFNGEKVSLSISIITSSHKAHDKIYKRHSHNLYTCNI